MVAAIWIVTVLVVVSLVWNLIQAVQLSRAKAELRSDLDELAIEFAEYRDARAKMAVVATALLFDAHERIDKIRDLTAAGLIHCGEGLQAAAHDIANLRVTVREHSALIRDCANLAAMNSQSLHNFLCVDGGDTHARRLRDLEARCPRPLPVEEPIAATYTSNGFHQSSNRKKGAKRK